MSIDFHLVNFPTLSQNHEPANPYPDVNAGMDCVPTSIAAALTWFTKTPYYGDEIIDQTPAYGPAYRGGTAASAFVDYCARRGVSLFPVDGSPPQLVAAIHSQLHQYRPVLVTVPGQWNNPATSGANPGDVTHVMVVCGDGAGLIQVMNPWTGAFEVYADSWFEVKLCYGQIWPMEGPMIPDGWTDNGTILTAPNGIKIDTGMRSFILKQPLWPRENVPLAPEHTLDQISSADPALGAGTRIDFLYCSVGWSRGKNAIGFMQVGKELAAAQTQPPPATDTKAAAAKAALKAWLAE